MKQYHYKTLWKLLHYYLLNSIKVEHRSIFLYDTYNNYI